MESSNTAINMAERDCVFALPGNMDSVVLVKQHIQKILQLLKIYGWVLDIYVSVRYSILLSCMINVQ